MTVRLQHIVPTYPPELAGNNPLKVGNTSKRPSVVNDESEPLKKRRRPRRRRKV